MHKENWTFREQAQKPETVCKGAEDVCESKSDTVR